MSLQDTEQVAADDTVIITNDGVTNAENEADESDDDFDSGFEGKLTETPAKVEPETENNQNQEQERKHGDEQQSEQSSSDEVAEILAKHGKQFDTVYGKLGSIEQVVNSLRQSPNISLSAEKLKRTFEEYPELAESLAVDLTEALSEIRGGSSAPEFDVNSIVNERIAETTRKLKSEIAMESLDETHPGWKSVVGMPDDNGQIPSTNFRKWLATQPKDYAVRVLDTYSPVVIGRAIDKFNEHVAAQKTATEKTQRLKAAVTPTSGKAQPSTSKASDDDFEAGFNGA